MQNFNPHNPFGLPEHALNCPLAYVIKTTWDKNFPCSSKQFVVGQIVKFISLDPVKGIMQVTCTNDEFNQTIYAVDSEHVKKLDMLNTPKSAALLELTGPEYVIGDHMYVVVDKETRRKSICSADKSIRRNYLNGDPVDGDFFAKYRVYEIVLPEDL